MRKLRHFIALALLGLTFAASVWHVFFREWKGEARSTEGGTTIYLGHWLVHTGMREAIDATIESYSALHPEVRVIQVPVHGRVYAAWVRAQLIGGMAPDITGLRALNEDSISRYFLPLGDWLAAPNPYNADTSLEGVPWRHTFVDGLNSVQGLTPTSGEIHGIMLQLNSHRLYYNRDLLREITGSEAPPRHFADLQKIAQALAHHNRKHGRKLVPIAVSGLYSRFAFNGLLPSQTQSLLLTHSPNRNLRITSLELASLLLDGRLSYATPELRTSLELMHDASLLFSPGFTQIERDEAVAAFAQERALMVFAGSWDYSAILSDVRFAIGAVPLPTPSKADPHYGCFTFGDVAENAGIDGAMGLVRHGPNPEVAIDFLRYLSSQPGASKFSRISQRISSVINADLPVGIDEIAPRFSGEAPGPTIDFGWFSAEHTSNFFQRHIHEVLGEKGDVAAFADTLDSSLPQHLREDIRSHLRNVRRDVRRLDASVVFAAAFPYAYPSSGSWTRHAEVQHLRQIESLHYRGYDQ